MMLSMVLSKVLSMVLSPCELHAGYHACRVAWYRVGGQHMHVQCERG